jgi:hypothetical protein
MERLKLGREIDRVGPASDAAERNPRRVDAIVSRRSLLGHRHDRRPRACAPRADIRLAFAVIGTGADRHQSWRGELATRSFPLAATNEQRSPKRGAGLARDNRS